MRNRLQRTEKVNGSTQKRSSTRSNGKRKAKLWKKEDPSCCFDSLQGYSIKVLEFGSRMVYIHIVFIYNVYIRIIYVYIYIDISSIYMLVTVCRVIFSGKSVYTWVQFVQSRWIPISKRPRNSCFSPFSCCPKMMKRFITGPATTLWMMNTKKGSLGFMDFGQNRGKAGFLRLWLHRNIDGPVKSSKFQSCRCAFPVKIFSHWTFLKI